MNHHFDFSEALKRLKVGQLVNRAGWNGKGMVVFLNTEWECGHDEGQCFVESPFIAIKTADCKVVPWLPSQTDLLANDWEVSVLD